MPPTPALQWRMGSAGKASDSTSYRSSLPVTLKAKDMPIPDSTLSGWSHHQAATAFKQAHVPILEALNSYKGLS